MTLHSRPRRVAGEIKEALAQVIQYEMKDPRLSEALITVTGVDVSGDLQNAQVHVSVLTDDDEEAAAVLAALDHSKGFIKQRLGQAVKLRFMPELQFMLDTTGRHAARIQELLNQIGKESPAQGPAPADVPSAPPPENGSDEPN